MIIQEILGKKHTFKEEKISKTKEQILYSQQLPYTYIHVACFSYTHFFAHSKHTHTHTDMYIVCLCLCLCLSLKIVSCSDHTFGNINAISMYQNDDHMVST